MRKNEKKPTSKCDIVGLGVHCLYFSYGTEEIAYLGRKDRRLGRVIDAIGHIDRAVDTDLFAAVAHHIIGQQISTAAQAKIWQRMQDGLGQVSVDTVCAADTVTLQRMGMTFKKADYILDFAQRVHDGTLDLAALGAKSDAQVIAELSALRGIGVWTAEMILLFAMQRPDVFSFGDLAIHRGLRMLYRHKTVDRARFERYRQRYSPYGTVASLYLWAVAGDAVPELTDPAADKTKQKGRRAQP